MAFWNAFGRFRAALARSWALWGALGYSSGRSGTLRAPQDGYDDAGDDDDGGNDDCDDDCDDDGYDDYDDDTSATTSTITTTTATKRR